MVTELTKGVIEHAFDAMGQMAAERGLVIEIAVYGGSCLILASDIRGTSGDVDAVFLNEGQTVRRVADDVARRLGLPLDWINDAVTRTAPPIVRNRTCCHLGNIRARAMFRSGCGCFFQRRPICWR
jgi:hypothetical protein